MIRIPPYALNVTRSFLVLVLLFAVTPTIWAQVQLGTPKYGSFGGGPADTVNLGNLNAHFVIPILRKPGRGLPFNYDLTYDTTLWEPVSSGSAKVWNPLPGWGWNGSALNVGTAYTAARGYDYQYVFSCESSYVDGFGTPHWFTLGYSDSNWSPSLWGCALYNWSSGIDYPLSVADSTASIAPDGSGYTFSADVCANGNVGGCEILLDSQYLPLAVQNLTASNGNGIVPQGSVPLSAGVSAGSVLDRNGNEVTVDGSGNYWDTLGLVALTTSGGSPDPYTNPYTLTYTDPNGHPATVSVTYRPYTVMTNFGCSGISEYGPLLNALVDRVTLPNGTYYQFSYETTPGYSGDVTGRLASITLPSGGAISYSYTGGSNGIVCTDGTAAGLTRQTPDGTWTYARTAGTGAAYTTTITDPSASANTTVIQFQGIYETERQIYQGSVSPSNLLETINTCYTSSPTFPCTGTSVSLPITQRDVQTILGSSYSEHNYSYNSSYGMPTEVDDYDWGSGSKGALLKKTLYTYASSLGDIKSFAQTVTVQNGAGTQIALTTNNYDGYALAATSGVPKHIDPPAGTPRGNLTSVQRWLNTTGGSLTTQNTYLDTGMLAASTDPNGNTTTYTYSSAFGGAYLTQTSNALGQVTTNNYNSSSGVLSSTTDPNGQTTSFSYDSMLRPTQTTYPDGGQTAICYTDEGGSCSQAGPPYNVVTTAKVTGSLNAVSTSVTDGLGRVTQTQLNSDPSGVDYADTAFDTLGRTVSISNPHRSGSSPTDGTICYGTVSGSACQKNGYDGLGRITEITEQDGSAIGVSYTGNCTTVADEAGKARESCFDGLGRITGVWEDPGTSPHLNYETDYSYDASGNLTQVQQKGGASSLYWRTRTFTYDSLSRLTQAVTPESGTVSYTYDAGGNVLTKTASKENQSSPSTTVTTTYLYDALNRLTQTHYSDGTTPTVSYVYDGASPSSCSVGSFSFGYYGIGRRTAMCDGPGSEAWLFDPMGRILADQRTTNSVTKAATYAYNYDGTLATLGYPSGSTITYTTNGAEQPTAATDTGNSISYASIALYDPVGDLSSLTNSTGILTTLYYNARRQPCRFAVNSGGTAPTSCSDPTNVGNVLDELFNFGASDNGNVLKVSDKRTSMSGRNTNYSYDVLNRINTAYTDATSGSYCWGESYTIDAWSNLTGVTPTLGSGCGGETFSVSQNTGNQLSSICTGTCYDAPGNLLNDSLNSYSYDAESRVTTGASVTYIYDGDGRRVEKSSGVLYWYDIGSNVLDETDTSGNLTNEYVFFNGKRIARRQIR